MWQRMVDISAKMFSEVYSRLGVDPGLKLQGESYYNSRIPGVIEELQVCKNNLYALMLRSYRPLQRWQAKGLTDKDGDAVIVRVPGQDVPVMLRKSDGGYGYDSTDLASLKYRFQVGDEPTRARLSARYLRVGILVQELDADWLIYVVDSGQSLHFQLVFDAAQQAGWYGPRAAAGSRAQHARVEHVGFGVVQVRKSKR